MCRCRIVCACSSVIKARDLEHQVPEIEQALLECLNSNEAMQQSYACYLENLREEVALTIVRRLNWTASPVRIISQRPPAAKPMNYSGNGVNFYGDRSMRLFLDDIYEQQEHMQMMDYRIQLATAPVVWRTILPWIPNP